MTTTATATTAAPVITRRQSVPRVQHTGLRVLIRDTLVFARRNVEHIRQIPEKLLDVTMQPIMFVLLFGFVFGGAINVPGNYREYLIGGILIQSLAFGMMGPAMSIASDLGEGVIDRFRSLPAAKGSYLLGHFVAELGGLALSIAILTGTGFAIGWRTHAAIGSVVGAVALLLLFSAAMIWTGTWVGMMVRSTDAVQGVMFTLVFPLTFLSNAFVPIESMPRWLQPVAVWNPASTMVAAVRHLFGNPEAPLVRTSWALEHAVLMSVIYCGLMLVVAVPMALRRYRIRTTD
jgi:ABC transporter DrrB family efflux protein